MREWEEGGSEERKEREEREERGRARGCRRYKGERSR